MENNTELINKALEFAKIAHAGQKRKNGEDFINHPIRVKNYLDKIGQDKNAKTEKILLIIQYV